MKNLHGVFLKTLLRAGIFIFILGILFGSFHKAYAVPEILKTKCTANSCPFTFLAPIDFPGFNIEGGKTDVSATGKGVNKYLAGLYTFGIAIASALAVIMIVFGGVQYSTTDAINSKSEGKQTITAALTGLILALLAYTLLNTINRNLTTGQFTPASIAVDPGISGGAANGAVDPVPNSGTGGTGGNNNGTTQEPGVNAEGWLLSTNDIAIDTDGTERPPFHDPDWQGETSLPGLNANKDYYVVVPVGSSIPLRTRVQVTDLDTGKTFMAQVGDRGPAGKYGEISLALARDLGVWREGMGNSANQHNLVFKYFSDSGNPNPAPNNNGAGGNNNLNAPLP